ncbi:MAG: 4-hydroxybenzoate octaprenyltransferase [Nitrospirales bacterium]|nr:4-hydroxybenzoate octaprenyltransferase [Nitrospirales bacterium]
MDLRLSTPTATHRSSPIFITVSQLALLIRLRNQSGTLLLVLPSFWALVLASHGSPQVSHLIIFFLGAFFMRSAGVAMNDLADRSFDAQVARTQHRPLACGALRPSHAIGTIIVFLTLSASLLLFLPIQVALLSPIAFLLAGVYPFTKRFFHLPQFFLGLAFGWGVVMAWTTSNHQLILEVWILFGATILWAIAYDTIYALQDIHADLQVGIKSSAILFGQHVWLAVSLTLLGMLILLSIIGWRMQLNSVFYVTLTGIAGFLSQQVWRLRSPLSPNMAFSMFRQHIWIGICILAGLWIGCL